MPINCIEIKDLSVSYHGNTVLDNINLNVPENTLGAIIGPNGAGKSTLLKSSLELIDRDKGDITFWNKPFNKSRKRIAYIPQRGTIDWDFPATVLDVVLMGLYVHKGLFKRINKSDKDKALEAIKRVNLSDFKDRQISQLSGGQQQRVFIARALVQEPDLYLMDEPFAGVDASSEHEILIILKELVASKKTILVVHHDLDTVKSYFDFVILLNKELKAFGDMKETLSNSNLKLTYGSLIPNFED